jgi:hypothetical protein
MPYVDGDNLPAIEDGLPAGQLAAYHEALGAANRELDSIRGDASRLLTGPGDASRRAGLHRHGRGRAP